MRMLGLLLSFGVLLIVIMLTSLHFFAPNTRSGTHVVTLNGTLDDVWAVYTDPGTLPEWRDVVLEVVDLEGEPGQRRWTEVLSHNVRIDFEEARYEPPRRYELRSVSEGYFTGNYAAQFEQVGPRLVRGEFTEAITTYGLRSKILALIFIRPQKLIEAFAHDAQKEIERRAMR